ncbi:MAG TPA: hemerythrin domain-containing protein [Vicinamibacterales bacterium]|nr:hemerythrin domain-containing protein [Vicinamibacterales bacterium]
MVNPGWDRPDAPLDELCDAIIERHHTYLHGVIPLLRGWLGTLAAREPQLLPALAETRAAFGELADQLVGHLAKEETILFPALVALAQAAREGASRPPLPFPTVLHPIRMMESEHARLEQGLERLRAVAGDFALPADASDAARRCYVELGRLDREVRAHLLAENDVLFPRALELERRLH